MLDNVVKQSYERAAFEQFSGVIDIGYPVFKKMSMAKKIR